MNIISKTTEMDVFDDLRYIDHPLANVNETRMTLRKRLYPDTGKPIVSIILGQGLQKIVKQGHVEFTEDLICQRIIIKGINCVPSNYVFELICDNGNTMQIQSGDMLSLRRMNWFRESVYHIVATTSNGTNDWTSQETTVATFTISWPSRQMGPNAKSDFTALMVIQGDEHLSLPKRTFWSFWSRLGQGIIGDLEEYRKHGSLPKLPEKMIDPNHFRGIRSVLEHGDDKQIQALMYYAIGTVATDPQKLRFMGNTVTADIEIDALIYDLGIIYGYEYPISDEFLLYFRKFCILE